MFIIKGRAQAAVEFIMTYGWAILVVLVAIGALSYFGVLSPGGLFPKKCTLPIGITCIDFNIESTKIVIVLQNNIGETITLDRIDVAKRSDANSCSNTESITLKNDQKAFITIFDCNNGNVGKRFDGNITITYTKESGLSHRATGSIIAKILEGSATSTSSICQDAENNDLCPGLDIVFGIGYRAACQNDHDLCW